MSGEIPHVQIPTNVLWLKTSCRLQPSQECCPLTTQIMNSPHHPKRVEQQGRPSPLTQVVGPDAHIHYVSKGWAFVQKGLKVGGVSYKALVSFMDTGRIHPEIMILHRNSLLSLSFLFALTQSEGPDLLMEFQHQISHISIFNYPLSRYLFFLASQSMLWEGACTRRSRILRCLEVHSLFSHPTGFSPTLFLMHFILSQQPKKIYLIEHPWLNESTT